MQNTENIRIETTESRPSSEFALLLSSWLKDHKATKIAGTQPQLNSTINNSINSINPTSQINLVQGDDQESKRQDLPSWVFEQSASRLIPSFASISLSPTPALPSDPTNQNSDITSLVPQFEKLSTADVAPATSQLAQRHQIRSQYSNTSNSSAYFKRSQAKYTQPWRRTTPEVLPRKTGPKRSTNPVENLVLSVAESSIEREKHASFYLPHDILLAIFSHLPSRANAQQYFDRIQPSDLLTCSRVNMAWRIAALSTIWQTIVLPDPFDRSCRRLLHLLASSHVFAQVTGKNYDITEIVQRVEVDLLEATELLSEERDFDANEHSTSPDMTAMTDHITTLLEYVSPFRTLSIQLPQEIESNAAQILAKDASTPIFDAIIGGIQDANIRELDMPSPMYCSVATFPGMLNLISNLGNLRVLVLGYSSRDWPLLKAVISLQHLENLCVFDSCWSNQIWIYLISSLGSRLRGLTAVQGRRPLEGPILREGIAPFCQNLTILSIPFIQLMSGSGPVLKDADLIPVIKACHELQNINISGQRLLGDAVLGAIADLWGLQILDIRDCTLMTGQNVKSVRWQSIQRVRMSGCGEISQEFMDLILQAWRSTTANPTRYPTGSGQGLAAIRFNSVLDFNADVEDPVEMGWVRQREDEPPLALDEDHFFADWYI
ncbi:hypothetical protein BGZ76_002891 [Entomortierella beljakovae]|nr:hypothetical protein BGZ76_002891 [Entomortierella beljakovae]